MHVCPLFHCLMTWHCFTVALFDDAAFLRQVEAFFKEHEAPGAERAIQQALEVIRSNANWLGRDRAVVEQWLNEHKDL